MTNRHSKLTKTILTPKKAETVIVTLFIEHSIIGFKIPAKILAEKGPNFKSKFLDELCTLLYMKTRTKTKYHPQTHQKIKQFN